MSREAFEAEIAELRAKWQRPDYYYSTPEQREAFEVLADQLSAAHSIFADWLGDNGDVDGAAYHRECAFHYERRRDLNRELWHERVYLPAMWWALLWARRWP